MGNRISLFLSIALFTLFSIGLANASLTITSNTITTPIDYPQNAIYTINGISGGVPPYTFNAYIAASPNSLTINGASVSLPVFLGSNTFSPSATYNAIIITINSILSTSANEISISAYNGVISAANLLFSNTISAGTSTIYGVWTFNAFFADSTTANTISSSNTLRIDPPLEFTSLTASNSLIDEGQTQVITAQVSGGTSPYTYNFMVYNSISLVANALYTGVNAPSYSFTFTQDSAWGTGPFTVNAYITDSANSPVTVSNTIIYGANAPLETPQVSISNTLLDEGQQITIAASFAGGTSPYTYNFIISQSGTPSNIIAFSGPVSNSLTSNSFVWTTNAIGTFVANVIVIDSASTPETTNSIYSVPFSVNAYPTATSLTASNTILDSGQYVTYNVLISGGTLPITANLILVSNSIPIQINSANALPGNTYNTIIANSDGVITFNSLLITTSSSGGSVTFNVVAVDSANTPVTFNAVANTITVNPALSVSISPTSNTLDANQVLPLSTTVTGGTPSFTIDYTLSNTLCGSLSATSNTLSADGTNTIVFSPNTAIASACTANIMVNVKDSASTNSIVSANSIITVYPTPTITLSVTPSNNIIYGGSFTINAMISGGTGNFVVYWYLNGNSIAPTIISQNTMTSNTMVLPVAGNYVYVVEANDIGASSVYTLSATNTIIVAKNNTLIASSSGNPGSAYYSYPVTITFTGTPTINHQAKWSLYVNGQLYGTTNSTIKYYEAFAPPGAYNFVFNLTNDANYTSYTYTTSLLISYPPTSSYGSTTTVTTVTTTSTTTSIPTTSVTTTIPPSQKAINITSTISSSSPLVLSLPNTHSTISVYTNYTAPTHIVAHIANATQQVSKLAKPQPNYTLINAVNVSIKTTAPVTVLFVEQYPCSIPSGLVAPYIFKNNTWLAVSNYTVNAMACTISLYIPNDPIVAIFEKSVPTTTTTSIATTMPTTMPTTIYYPSPSPNPSNYLVVEALTLIIILIIVILVLLYYYKLLHKYHYFKR